MPATKTSKSSKAAATAIDMFRERLRASGLRVTPGRIAVLQHLERRTAPITHADLAAQLGEKEYDRVTLWRVLTALTEAGFVDRTDVGDHVWRFELRRESGESTHPHFMCIECNVVQCLPRESVQVSSRLARGVTEIQVKGRCGDCYRR